MGATYGLGIARSTLDTDASRETAIELLQSIARFTGQPVRDLIGDDEVVEVSPDGAVKPLAGARATEIKTAIEEKDGSASYSAFKHLDGYHILLPGNFDEGAPEDVPDGLEIYVGPLADLKSKLDRLIARDDVEEPSQLLHRALRALSDDAERLGVPLVLGS